MNSKHYILPLFIVIVFSGCFKVSQIGKLTMVADRNIGQDLSKYVLLKSYSGGSKKEIKKAFKKYKPQYFDEAVDVCVRNVPGGEFLKNVKVYSAVRFHKVFLYVEGDVWGHSENTSYKGFDVGDFVQWVGVDGKKVGIILHLTDGEKCMVQENGKSKAISIKYSRLKKLGD